MVIELMREVFKDPYQACAYFKNKKTLEVWGTENDYEIYRIQYWPATGRQELCIDQMGLGTAVLRMSDELKAVTEPMLKTIIKALRTNAPLTTIKGGDVIIREYSK